MPPKKKAEPKIIDITAVERGQFTACLLGTSPIWLNRMSQKAWRELLFPLGRKTSAQKQSNLKHHPLEEYRSSPYIDHDPNGPTAMQIVAASVKKATASVPLDIPDTGTSKAQLERLLFAPEQRISLYGIPQLGMAVVRMADQNKTPDIRTRAVVPHWACRVQLTYVMPVLRQEAVLKFLAIAGFMRGIGDWRPEKGSGNFGCFEIVEPDDQRFLHIIEHGGRAAQLAALETPDFFDSESAEMYQWFQTELVRRARGHEARKPPNGDNLIHVVEEPEDVEEVQP